MSRPAASLELANRLHQAVKEQLLAFHPDTFKDEAEVVLKGKLSPDGFHVDPNGVMAKCPSKYEVKDSPIAGKSGA